MDWIIAQIAALGVPGLILLVTMAFTGWAGAAAITTALALLGGPFGMLGGIGVLGIMGLISKGLAEYGFENLCIGVVDELKKQGKSPENIMEEIDWYPISDELKARVKAHILY